MYCAPSNKKTLPNSCYTNEQIINIAKSFNLYNKSNLINIEQSPIHIYNDLKIKLNNIREDLWLDNTENTKFLSDTELKNIFIPKMPNEWCSNITKWRNQTNNSKINAPWLSNFDIEDVINQYHNKYPHFIFLGTHPIDFQNTNLFGCISNLCSFNIDNIISKNKYCFGIVLNTDKHNQSGSHWISIYCNLNTCKIYFFNSANNNDSKIPQQVIDFVKNIHQQVLNLYKKNLDFKFNNKISHQSSNSECGMYSIYLILSLLDADHNNIGSDSVFDNYFNNPLFTIEDSVMLQKRFSYFRPNQKCNI